MKMPINGEVGYKKSYQVAISFNNFLALGGILLELRLRSSDFDYVQSEYPLKEEL